MTLGVGEVIAVARLTWDVLRAIPWSKVKFRRPKLSNKTIELPARVVAKHPRSFAFAKALDAVAGELFPDCRLPAASDLSGEWAEYAQEEGLFPVAAKGDFRGAGRNDYAVILPYRDRVGYRLVAFLESSRGTYSGHLLDSSSEAPQQMFVRCMAPGRYRPSESTAIVGQPRILALRLRADAINFGVFESADSVFYWEPRKRGFERVWMSD